MLSQLLDPTLAGRFLQQQLPFFQTRHAPSLSEIRLRDVRLGDWWQFQYHLKVEPTGVGSASPCILTCHYGDPRDLDRVARKLEPQRELLGGRSRRLEQLWLDRSEAGVLVVPFPLDSKLPHLLEATDPDEVTKRLRGLGLLQVSAAHAVCRAEVLRYASGRRCQIRYHLRHGDPVRLLGKTFRDDRGRVIGDVMNQVASLFRGHGNTDLLAPRAPAYLPEWRMAIQEHVPGSTLNRLLRKRTLEESALARAGECLAVLHCSSLLLSGLHSVEHELKLLESVHARLQKAGYDCPIRERLLTQIRRFGGELRPTRLCPVHRDFHDKQLLIQGPRLWLIDLDTATTGPPEIDVSNFVAHLRLRSLQGLQSGDAGREALFLKSYQNGTPPLDPDLLDFFLASTFFRLSCRYRLRFQGQDLASSLSGLGRAALGPARTGHSHGLAVKS